MSRPETCDRCAGAGTYLDPRTGMERMANCPECRGTGCAAPQPAPREGTPQLWQLPAFVRLIPIAEWPSETFKRHDGMGHYATVAGMDLATDCFNLPPPSWATHVAWFNK